MIQCRNGTIVIAADPSGSVGLIATVLTPNPAVASLSFTGAQAKEVMLALQEAISTQNLPDGDRQTPFSKRALSIMQRITSIGSAAQAEKLKEATPFEVSAGLLSSNVAEQARSLHFMANAISDVYGKGWRKTHDMAYAQALESVSRDLHELYLSLEV